MAKNDIRLKTLIKHLELMKKRQGILARLHDEYSTDRAISVGKFNTIDLMIDLANAYMNGEPWPYKMFEKLARKVNGRYYYNNKEGG